MKKSLLLVSDIDGTLLDSKGQLSQKNVKAIQHFMAQGHYFALSTGRTPVSAQPILDALQPNAPSIFMNGALLQEKNGTIVHATALEKEKLIEFLHQLPSLLPHCVIEIFTTHEIYLISNPENKDPFIEDNHIPVIYTTLEQLFQETWLKILICEKQVNEVEKLVQSFHLHEQFNTFFLRIHSMKLFLKISVKEQPYVF